MCIRDSSRVALVKDEVSLGGIFRHMDAFSTGLAAASLLFIVFISDILLVLVPCFIAKSWSRSIYVDDVVAIGCTLVVLGACASGTICTHCQGFMVIMDWA